MVGFNYAVAKMAPRHSRRRLRGFLDGTEPVDLAQLKSHRDCKLGRWIYSEGMSRYGRLPEMCELEKKHKWMHGTARQVVSLRRSGDVYGAELEFEKVRALSDEVVGLLTRLEKQVTPGST
jgi:hypothetical protein